MYGRNGSDGVPCLTLDETSSPSAQEIPLYTKREILNPVIKSTITDLRKTLKLSPKQQQEVITQHATGQSLRELARSFGVSYETIRTTIKRYNQGQASQKISESFSDPELKGGL